MTTETEPRPAPQTLAEMEARRDVLEEEVAAIKAKLENVRAKRHATGEYADPDWYRRAMTRQRFLGVEHQRLLRSIAEMKRAQRQVRASTFEQAFVAAAREILDAASFQQLMAMATARAAG